MINMGVRQEDNIDLGRIEGELPVHPIRLGPPALEEPAVHQYSVPRLQLKKDNVSVAEKIAWLSDLLEHRHSLDLMQLLTDLPTMLDRIATFLAVLEMARLQMLVVFQRKMFDEIRIALAPDVVDEAPAEVEQG